MDKKENLKKLLDFVSNIALEEENKWFREKLLSKIRIEDSHPEITKTLSKIEKYLDLEAVEIIDYSDISDSKVRNQLVADNIQMQKYRLGKIGNEINFAEYCRYAHYQAEELVNYFYNKKFQNFEEVKKFLKKLNIEVDADAVESISYYYKSKALAKFLSDFKNKHNLSKIKIGDILYKINYVRNEISHRSNSSIKKSDDEILDQISKNNIDISGYIDFTNNPNQKLISDGLNIKFKREQNFAIIATVLYELKTLIIYFVKSN